MYPVLGKIAAKYNCFSVQFVLIYCLIIFVLFIYALIWQQALKRIPLTVAIANKSITIVWGMILGALIFKERLSLKMFIGAFLIVLGIVILITEKDKES